MTPLDQAFTKVYPDWCGALPSQLDSLLPGSPADGPVDPPPEEISGAPAGLSVEDVLEALQATTARIGDLLPPQPTLQTPQGDHGDRPAAAAAEITTPALVRTGSIPAGADELETGPVAEKPVRPATGLRVDPSTPAGSTARHGGDHPIRRPHMLLPRAEGAEKTGGSADAGAPRDVSMADQPRHRRFQPMLQVDRFIWPGVCCRLGEAAADELDRLADRLADMAARGARVVAIGGCRRGEGATTLLLCAGRRLAERGLRVVMADANLADPQLACRLGLLPQAGWEDVLAGRLPLEEAVIESVGDRLAVLPVGRSSADSGATPEDENRLAESIRTLSADYDLVLLDPGPLEELGTVGASLARGIGNRLDGIALVHHGGVTPREALDEVRRRLAATEIAQVGVVENFVCD